MVVFGISGIKLKAKKMLDRLGAPGELNGMTREGVVAAQQPQPPAARRAIYYPER